MVLNHVSVASPDLHTALEWLKDLARGMAQLSEIAQSSIRMRFPVHEIRILPECSLHQAYQELRKAGERDEYVYLMRLTTKFPFLTEVESDIKNRLSACEARQFPQEDGEPLVLCAITNWIAIGFPSDPAWDNHQLTVHFDELLPDESIEETSETVDNLSRSRHARLIRERQHAAFLQFQSPSELWAQREEAFPNLVFGPDVKRPSQFLGTALRRLADLDASAAKWQTVKGPAPPWSCKVTPESETVRNNEKLLNARRFRSRRGTQELFEWHARLGSGFRIHLRFCAETHEVEIGYIGPKRPV